MTLASRIRSSSIVLVLVALAGLLVAAPGAGAQEKSFTLVSLTVEATVGSDAAMDVVEQVTYDFSGGPFTIGVRSFLREDRSRIEAFEAFENGQSLLVDPPSQTPTGEWEWHFATPATNEVRTFELHYRVPRAVQVGTDVGDLYWMFLGEDHSGVGSVRIDISVPGQIAPASLDTPDTDTSVLRAWGHGPRQGVVGLAPSSVTLQVDGVPAGRFVEARVAIPRDAFDVDASAGALLPGILAEEGAAIDATLAEDRGRAVDPPPSRFAQLLGPFGALAGLLGAAFLWFRHGRELAPDPLVGEYWREPLDEPPVVALANMKRSSPDLGTSIAATVIDLAQRGHLTIEERKIERFGPDKVELRLTRTGKQDTELEAFEQRLLSYVFSSGPTTTVDEITERASRDQSGANSFASGFQRDISTAVKARHYEQGIRSGIGKIAILGGAIALFGLVGLILGSALGIVGFAGAIAAVGIAGVGLRNRTQAGADEAAKAKGLKKYIEDFSNLSEAPAGHLILWERFLVYAVAFGVSRELLKGLATRLPSVLNDPSYGAWYVGLDRQRRFDSIERFPNSFGKATASAVAPSKSGSGGGFSSSGGGGGGGGGGFGAR